MSHGFSRDPAPNRYQPQYGRDERSPPVYHDYRDLEPNVRYHEGYGNASAGLDRYEPQPRPFDGEAQPRYFDGHIPGDHYDGRSLASFNRVGGFTAINRDGGFTAVNRDGGFTSRGGGASGGNNNASLGSRGTNFGGNAPRNGQTPSSRLSKRRRKEQARRQGS